MSLMMLCHCKCTVYAGTDIFSYYQVGPTSVLVCLRSSTMCVHSINPIEATQEAYMYIEREIGCIHLIEDYL